MGLITALLKTLGDPDWAYIPQLEHGVPLDVEEDLALAPPIWPNVTPDPRPLSLPCAEEKYLTGQQFAQSIHETYKEEMDLG